MNLQVLNGYLESAKKHMEEELSDGAAITDTMDMYSVQSATQEQPEAQRELSEVKETVKELVQQNSQVLPGDSAQTHASNHAAAFACSELNSCLADTLSYTRLVGGAAAAAE